MDSDNDKSKKKTSKPGSPSKKADGSPSLKQNDSFKNLKSKSKLKTQKKDDNGDDSDNTEKAGAAGGQFKDDPKSPAGKSPGKAAKPPARKKKAPTSGEAGGQLSQDFQSFDILWFDLTTKTRALVTELCAPVIDKVHEHKDLLNRLVKEQNDNFSKVDALECVVYDRDKKLDVFEQIYEKIGKVESDRLVVEQRLENNDEMIMQTFKDFEFKMSNHEKELKTMVKNTEQALDDLSDLKDTIRTQNDALSCNIREVSENMVKDSTELRAKMSELWSFMAQLKQRTQEQSGGIERLSNRMDTGEKNIAILDSARVDIEQNKCDNLVFQRNIERMDSNLKEQYNIVAETRDNCTKLAHYQEKYQPVRVQAMIGDTLYACLEGSARRNHELYDSDKLSLLYRDILEDSGEGNGIANMIMRLNEKAKHKIGEEEKAKRRLQQASQDAAALEGNESSQGDQDPVQLFTPAPENQEGQAQSSNHQKSKSKTMSQKASNHNINLKTSQSGQSKGAFAFGASNPNLPNLHFPEAGHFKLLDLIQSDFQMGASDPDYKLTHEQLIKATKVLLHKFNCQDLKNVAERDLVEERIDVKFKNSENVSRSNLDEQMQLIHAVHADFEQFIKKYSKKDVESTVKITKLSEVGHRTLDNLDEVKESIEKVATIITCLLEFDSIAQAISHSDENEYTKLQFALNNANVAPPKSNGNMKRQASESKKGKTSAGNLNPTVTTKQPGNFFPTYQTLEDGISGQNKSLDMMSSKRGSTNVPLSIDSIPNQGSLGSVFNGQSKVNYRQNVITKSQLLDMRRTLLEKCEEVIDGTTWPFQRNNLSTAKIFNDLIQFHGDNMNPAAFLNHHSIDGSGSLHSVSQSKALLKQLTPHVGRNNMGWAPTPLKKGSLGGGPSQMTGFTAHSSTIQGRNKGGMHNTQIINFHQGKNSTSFQHSGGASQVSYPGGKMNSGASNLATGVFAGGQVLSGGSASFYNGGAPQTDRPNHGNSSSSNHGRKQSQAIPDMNQTAPDGTLGAYSPERTHADQDNQNLKLPNI